MNQLCMSPILKLSNTANGEAKDSQLTEEWLEVGYTEKRIDPTDGYIQGKTYPYPTGEKPIGANCLSDCDAETFLPTRK